MVVLQSASLREASRAVVFTVVFFLLSSLVMRTAGSGITIPRILLFEFLAAASAVGVTAAFIYLIPPQSVSNEPAFADMLLCMILVPIAADRSLKRERLSGGRTTALVFVFSVLILTLSLVREFFTVGSIWGYPISSGMIGRFPYLSDDSSAALIVAAFLITLRLILRKMNSTLRIPEDEEDKVGEVPYLDAEKEREQFTEMVLLLVITLLMACAVFGFVLLLQFLALKPFLLLVFIVPAQALIVGPVSVFARRRRGSLLGKTGGVFVLPIQLATVLLPIDIVFGSALQLTDPVRQGTRYLSLLLLLWILACLLRTFVITFKRKMIFGKRPKSIEGLPFVFILTALAMIILSAFAGLMIPLG